MSPEFSQPLPLLLWTAGIATTVVFLMLGASNWGSFRRLRRREYAEYAGFTLLAAAQASTVVVVFLPFSADLKAQLFRLMWVFGTGSLFFWVRSLVRFADLRSRWLSAASWTFLAIGLIPLADVVWSTATGPGFFYALEPRPDASIALRATGNVVSHRPVADAAAAALSLVVLTVSCLLVVKLIRRKSKDWALVTGVLLTPTLLVAELVLVALVPSHSVPLLFMANLVEGIRITRSSQERLFREAFEIRSALNQETALVEGQLKNLVIQERLAQLGARTAELSHDIRNPLTTVTAGLDLIEDLLEETPTRLRQIRESLADVRLAVSHVLAIVQRITRHGRRNDEPWRTLQVDQLVRDALSLCRARLASIALETTLPTGLRIRGRRTELSQVLVNLLINAAEAIESQDEPWIRIVAEARPGRVVLSLTDSGERPPVAVVENMFRPHFSTNKNTSSTGLGLSICAQIMEQHSARLAVDPSQDHTTFVLEFQELAPPAESALARTGS